MALLNLTIGSFSSGVVAATSSYESIATFNATGSETTFDFTSIPATYKHLQLRALFQRTTSTQLDVGIRLNSDTGSNYSQHSLSGDGSAVAAAGAANNTYVAIGVGPGGGTGNYFGASIVDIIDYASTTKNKTIRSFNGANTNNAGISAIKLLSGAWYNTTAVNAITIFTFGDAMNTNTTFALYGIKGA